MKNSYSVLMSVYAQEQSAYLEQSIQSIWEQTADTDDFVLVCDGPLTPELDVVIERQYAAHADVFHVIRLDENKGLGNALREGITYCKNELVARMDSDDLAFPDRCERQLAVFESEPVDFVSGTAQEFTDLVTQVDSQRVLPQTAEEILVFAKRRNPVNHPCVMYKKSAVLRAGNYQTFYLFEDYHLWVRMLMDGAQGYNLPQPLVHMRAGRDMYRRRGGWVYVRSMLHFRWWMKKSGFSGWDDFLISGVGQALVCLLPGGVRQRLYGRFLRGKVEAGSVSHGEGGQEHG